MKKYLLILSVGLFGIANAQIPTGYYDSASGLTGFALKTKLGEIITAGYVTKSMTIFTMDTQQQTPTTFMKKTEVYWIYTLKIHLELIHTIISTG